MLIDRGFIFVYSLGNKTRIPSLPWPQTSDTKYHIKKCNENTK